MRLKRIYSFFCTENLLLIFLEFLCNISLGIDQSLLSYPFRRNGILMSIADFEIISEYIVEAYLERLYSGTFDLALLDFKEIISAMTGNLTQLV